MKYYFAPMEGITIYTYRNALEECFGGIDKYFTPFLMPNGKRVLKTREKQDVLPEHNQAIPLVPQILTKKSEEFIQTAKALEEMGYDEVNLNLGCPSKTVVSKGKGSGFLTEICQLDQFLEEVFDALDLNVSVKTRIGKYHPDEFDEILNVFNRYPLKEVIIHPRIQTQFYQGNPNMEVFEKAVKHSRNPVCYNGDLVSAEDVAAFRQRFPHVDAVMIGRGLLRNPALVRQIKGGAPLQKEELLKMHQLVYQAYKEILSGEKNVLFKMKDFWTNPVQIFSNYKKYAKKIKKAQKLEAYEDAVKSLIEEQEILQK